MSNDSETEGAPPSPEVKADDTLILLAARGMLLFPRVVLPIVVGRDRSVRAVQAAVAAEKPIGILLQKDENDQTPGPDELYSIGTIANIVRYITAPDGSHHVIAQGEARFRVKEYVQVEPYLVARIERIEEPDTEHDSAIEARTVNLKAQANQALEIGRASCRERV